MLIKYMLWHASCKEDASESPHEEFYDPGKKKTAPWKKVSCYGIVPLCIVLKLSSARGTVTGRTCLRDTGHHLITQRYRLPCSQYMSCVMVTSSLVGVGVFEPQRELLCIREISGLSGSRVRIKRFYFFYYFYYFFFCRRRGRSHRGRRSFDFGVGRRVWNFNRNSIGNRNFNRNSIGIQ